MGSRTTGYLESSSKLRRVWYLIVVLVLLPGSSVHAQATTNHPPLRQWFSRIDSTLLFDLYTVDHPAVTGYVRAAHWTAVPVSIGSSPAVAVGEWLSENHEWERPIGLLAAQGGAYVLQYSLKALIRRPRPYAAYTSIHSRSASHPSRRDPFAFPSGHAALSFATATSLSLAYPHWYVIAPSVVWAGGVSLSRPWLGVHYPSDIVVGAVLGTAVGIGVHLLVPHVIPRPLR